MTLWLEIYMVIHNYQTPWCQMAKLCYYALFGVKIPSTKHEIMVRALSLNLPTLLTAFTCFNKTVCLPIWLARQLIC